MRTISAQFKELQDELIRPQMELFFEIGTNELNPAIVGGSTRDLGLDDTVAPIVPPKNCSNQRYYAIVGDGMPVDDPNRICAPDNTGDIAEPDGSVPYGVSPYTSANSQFLLGSDANDYENFTAVTCPITLCFAGGHIPEMITVEIYDTDTDSWAEETTLLNPNHKREIKYTPEDIALNKFHRFKLKNSTEGGRFIFNWGKREVNTAVSFTNTEISTANIDQETDLTSQSLPSYEMTVEVLDIDELYKPDSAAWKSVFVDGAPCLFKCGFEINGEIEYIPLFYGALAKAPDYNEGKITFNSEITWRTNWYVNEFWSLVNHDLNTGDLVDDRTFENYIWTTDLFDDYSDAFTDQDDIDASVCNYYGEVDSNEVRQLVANALGCYITAGIGTINLHNANNIQYKAVDDYLTRYEQIQATLESKAKVGKIVVTRNENKLSASNYRTEVATRVYCRPDEITYIEYKVPFYAIGKFIVNDYQKSVPTATIQAEYGSIEEEISDDGTAKVQLAFTVSANTYIKPIVTFYGVDNTQFDETSYTDNDAGENYENNNKLITNSYTANKVNRVAHLVNDTNNQYEIDLMQNFQYELGDTVRLEMKDGAFKTCVITGLQFTLPGSAGHLTCRKIFAIEDDPNCVLDAENEYFGFEGSGMWTSWEITKTINGAVVIGYLADYTQQELVLFVIGATEFIYEDESSLEPTTTGTNMTLTDYNGHEWKILAVVGRSGEYPHLASNNIELPNYTSEVASEVPDVALFGAVELIKKLYEDQGMTAPVDYNCEYAIDT